MLLLFFHSCNKSRLHPSKGRNENPVYLKYMKHYFSLFLVVMVCSFAQAQTNDSAKVIGIHPAVGKSISREEKISYQLFTQYKDSLFESAYVLKLSDSTYEVVVRTIRGDYIRNQISSKEMDDLYYRVDEISKAGKQQNDHFANLSEEEKKRIRKQQRADAAGEILLDFLGQMVLVTLQVLLTAALTN